MNVSENLTEEQYLDFKVKTLFEPMIKKIILEKPDNPIPHMINWLARISGRNLNDSSEKEELKDLRKKMQKFKKMYNNFDEEILSESDSQEDTDESYDEVKELQTSKQSALKGINKRSSVSAEVYGKFNVKKAFVPKVVPKTEEQINRIRKRMSQCFIFSTLDEKDLRIVIDAMEERKFSKFDRVIKQGEQGDTLYLIDTGTLDCFKLLNASDQESTYIKMYQPGEAFGELALLYNAPRAATLIAKEDCLLWALDRESFNHIIKEVAVKKREKYEGFLKSVEILRTMDKYQIMQISDALKTKFYRSGEKIIKINDTGDEFFIIEEGEAIATKPLNENGPDTIVKYYKPGEYFGELALMRNELRAANVIAMGECKVISLDRKSFKRLLGPLESILGNLSKNYQ